MFWGQNTIELICGLNTVQNMEVNATLCIQDNGICSFILSETSRLTLLLITKEDITLTYINSRETCGNFDHNHYMSNPNPKHMVYPFGQFLSPTGR